VTYFHFWKYSLGFRKMKRLNEIEVEKENNTLGYMDMFGNLHPNGENGDSFAEYSTRNCHVKVYETETIFNEKLELYG
jgi:hypothetical protein